MYTTLGRIFNAFSQQRVALVEYVPVQTAEYMTENRTDTISVEPVHCLLCVPYTEKLLDWWPSDRENDGYFAQ